jgi:release factor glutamine methyltransferase
MKLRKLLKDVRFGMQEAGIGEACLESELLVRHALDINLVEQYLRMKGDINPPDEEQVWRLYRRRLMGEPLAYIMGKREFYGRDYYVNSSVLIPRPETELLVEKAAVLASGYSSPVIADVGTGSGAVVISLAGLVPRAIMYAMDISNQALEVARRNASHHALQGKITFLEGDLLSPLPEAADIITANLPYVRSDEINANFEPRLALDGGKAGLDVFSRLCPELAPKLKPGGSVLLEIGMGQTEAVRALLAAALPGAGISVFPDLAGIERVIQATLPSH